MFVTNQIKSLLMTLGRHLLYRTAMPACWTVFLMAAVASAQDKDVKGGFFDRHQVDRGFFYDTQQGPEHTPERHTQETEASPTAPEQSAAPTGQAAPRRSGFFSPEDLDPTFAPPRQSSVETTPTVSARRSIEDVDWSIIMTPLRNPPATGLEQWANAGRGETVVNLIVRAEPPSHLLRHLTELKELSEKSNVIIGQVYIVGLNETSYANLMNEAIKRFETRQGEESKPDRFPTNLRALSTMADWRNAEQILSFDYTAYNSATAKRFQNLNERQARELAVELAKQPPEQVYSSLFDRDFLEFMKTLSSMSDEEQARIAQSFSARSVGWAAKRAPSQFEPLVYLGLAKQSIVPSASIIEKLKLTTSPAWIVYHKQKLHILQGQHPIGWMFDARGQFQPERAG